MNRSEKERLFLLALQQASGGPVLRAPVGDWEHVFRFAGRELFCCLSGYRRFSHCLVGVPLGDRPISLQLAAPHARVSGLPPVSIADARFNASYRAYGAPEDVISAALVPPVCTWLVDAFQGDEPLISTGGPHLRLTIFVPDAAPLAPEAIHNWLSGALLVADALCRAYDERHALLMRTQGPDAVRAWVERARGLKAGGVTVSNPHALVFLLLILAVLLVCAAGALWFAIRQ